MTFLEDLRAEGAEVRKNAMFVLPVKASKFSVRFRPPSRDKLTGVVATYRVGGALTEDQELQLIVDCCDEIGTGVTLETFEPADPDGGPLRFDASDERWGDVESARDCVRDLYKLDLRPLNAAGVADALVDWLQGVDDEVVTRVEGKSESSED